MKESNICKCKAKEREREKKGIFKGNRTGYLTNGKTKNLIYIFFFFSTFRYLQQESISYPEC